LQLAVPTSSSVGMPERTNLQLVARERLAAMPSGGNGAEPLLMQRSVPDSTAVAVVRGPCAAACALTWHLGSASVPELVVLAGDPPCVVGDYGQAATLLERLAACPPTAEPVPAPLRRAVQRLVRDRLRTYGSGPADPDTRRLRRAVLVEARQAARRRDGDRLELLDSVLDRLTRGTRIGAAIALEETLVSRAPSARLRDWVRRYTTHSPQHRGPFVHVAALLCGTG